MLSHSDDGVLNTPRTSISYCFFHPTSFTSSAHQELHHAFHHSLSSLVGLSICPRSPSCSWRTWLVFDRNIPGVGISDSVQVPAAQRFPEHPNSKHKTHHDREGRSWHAPQHSAGKQTSPGRRYQLPTHRFQRDLRSGLLLLSPEEHHLQRRRLRRGEPRGAEIRGEGTAGGSCTGTATCARCKCHSHCRGRRCDPAL